MTHVQKLKGALEKLIDLSFADLVRGKKRMKIEIRKAAIGDAGGKKFAEAPGFDGTEKANFLEDDAAQRVLKNGSVEQAADFGAGTTFDEHGAQEAQSVALKKGLAVVRMRNHRNPGINFILHKMAEN